MAQRFANENAKQDDRLPRPISFAKNHSVASPRLAQRMGRLVVVCQGTGATTLRTIGVQVARGGAGS